MFLKGRVKDNGLLYPHKKLLVDILVSENSLESMLTFADDFFIAMENQGFSIDMSPNHLSLHASRFDERKEPEKGGYRQRHWCPYRPTVTFIKSTAIGFSLFEFTEDIEVMYVKGKYIPLSEIDEKAKQRYLRNHAWTTTREMASGDFCLYLYSPYQETDWCKKISIKNGIDGATFAKSVIPKLKKFTKEIAEQVKEAKIEAEKREREWQEQKARWDKEERLRKIQKAKSESHDTLIAAIEHWSRIRQIETFFNEVENEVAKLRPDQREQLKDRLKRAREVIGHNEAIEAFSNWKSPKELLEEMPPHKTW